MRDEIDRILIPRFIQVENAARKYLAVARTDSPPEFAAARQELEAQLAKLDKARDLLRKAYASIDDD